MFTKTDENRYDVHSYNRKEVNHNNSVESSHLYLGLDLQNSKMEPNFKYSTSHNLLSLSYQVASPQPNGKGLFRNR